MFGSSSLTKTNTTKKIESKLDDLRLLAIECFDKAVHHSIVHSSRRQTARDSLELDDQFHIPEGSMRHFEPDKTNDSLINTMTQKNRSLQFSAALSKIPDKKMSNLSIMDFKELLAASHNQQLEYDSCKHSDLERILENGGIEDQAFQDSTGRQKDSITKSINEKDRLKDSIFTPNQPIATVADKKSCCSLI